ncbi:MAG: anthranilate phosphoribosyltransferase [Micrococcales bacterium]|nr:anthranilate phosphoribosyltransferase [Micrococcales bacterium]
MSGGPGGTQPTWPELFTALVARRDLTAEQTGWAMDRIMSGQVSTPKIAAFLIALRAKGETVAELTGLADQMLAHSRRFTVPARSVDVVGTGGDMARTVNISTMAALVVAGAGLTVVKHGNRASSSASGSADVLEALGLNLAQPPERVADLATEVGITFCFAQVFHPSMRYVGEARKELGIGTAFNFLGPLTNPGQPESAAIGVVDPRMAPLVAGVLAGRGISALVFRGEDGLDELAPTSRSRVWEVRDGQVSEHLMDWTADLGLAPITVADLRGGDAATNATVVTEVLAGRGGPVRETVLLNAAAALVADATLPGTTTGTLTTRMSAALALAARSVDSGAAAAVLARWRVAAGR